MDKEWEYGGKWWFIAYYKVICFLIGHKPECFGELLYCDRCLKQLPKNYKSE